MRKLVLCEKPSVARDVAKALGISSRGDGCIVSDTLVITWCIGHLVELEEPAAYQPAWRRWSLSSLPMLPAPFALRPIKHTVKQWQVVRKLLKSREFSAVVNACDAGREGELIFRFCYELAGSSLPIERLWISSLTTQAITRGFAGLRDGHAYDALADAARCRAEADWLVGMNATRAVTLWRGGQTLLSLGRVQTPTLSLLVSREREIERFVPRDYFEIEAELAQTGTERAAPFFARFEHDGKRRFAAAPLAEAVADRDTQAPSPIVESVEEKPVREPPPLLFDLGALQRTCNRRFGWSAHETLRLAQALYEQHKLLTYPRTDSRHLSHDLVPQLQKTFGGLAKNPDYTAFCTPLLDGKVGAPRRIFQDHKVTDHHAIIPTLVEHSADRLAALSASERRLLDLVCRRFIGAFYPDAEFHETRAIIRVDASSTQPTQRTPPRAAIDRPAEPPSPPDADYLQITPPVPDRYVARGRVRVRAGWQEVAGFSDTSRGRRPSDDADSEEETDGDRDKAQALPPLAVGMRLGGTFAVQAKKTRPPPRYTEASLLAAMDGAGKKLSDEALRAAMQDHGLGTPATRAAIIETLLDRGYVTRQAKLLVPTELGLELISSLPVPGLLSAELTGRWEARLARMSRGEDSASAFMADIATYVRDLVNAVRSAPAQPALSAPPRPAARGARGTPTRRKSFRRTSRQTGDDTRPAAAATAVDKPTPAKRARRATPAGRKATEDASKRAAPTKTRARKAPAVKASGLITSGDPGASGRRRSLEKNPRRLSSTAASPPAAPPLSAAQTQPAPGTPVEPALLCPRCRHGKVLWGRRAWGCADFRSCSFVLPYELDGRRLSEIDLRRNCAAQRMTDSPGAASVASDRQHRKSRPGLETSS